MVKGMKKNGKTLYICQECGMAFEQKEWAEKCEAWCRENHSCNLEIMGHAVPQE